MKRFLACSAIVLSLIGLTGCTQPDRTVEILQRDGYTNIETQGYAVFGCSEDDWFRTKFTAEKNGQQVSGAVCAGMLKGATVRFN
jgi:biotin synthase-related radical SAM superfamily protein